MIFHEMSPVMTDECCVLIDLAVSGPRLDKYALLARVVLSLSLLQRAPPMHLQSASLGLCHYDYTNIVVVCMVYVSNASTVATVILLFLLVFIAYFILIIINC